MKENFYNNELKKDNKERKISNKNYETKGDIIINKLDLLDITKLWKKQFFTGEIWIIKLCRFRK